MAVHGMKSKDKYENYNISVPLITTVEEQGNMFVEKPATKCLFTFLTLEE